MQVGDVGDACDNLRRPRDIAVRLARQIRNGAIDGLRPSPQNVAGA
ncbi:MAG TPA: hypothetical protein VEN12_06585 [Verrucomicrobiae bacterium]|nr:hypothetical protein [Verrucomicrobiae bacterium]